MIDMQRSNKKQPLPLKQAEICLLASFPKSGNTWVRAFLSALLRPSQVGKEHHQSDDINNLIGFGFTYRTMTEVYSGVDTADLSIKEIAYLQKDALLSYAKQIAHDPQTQAESMLFMKSHNAYELIDSKTPLFSPESISKVIYIVRNPFDVTVSYAHHKGDDGVNSAIYDLGHTDCVRESGITKDYTGEWYSSWSENVTSWCRNNTVPASMKPLLIRYEDLHRQPHIEFEKMLRFIGLQHDSAQIHQAIEQASFNKLKKKEAEHGFVEKQISKDGFFRKGKIGDWQNVLTTPQVQQLITDHSEVMQWLGYLDKDNKPTEVIC